MISLVSAQDAIVENATPEVVNSAVNAVSDLGKQVVLGRYEVAIQRMYPQWKDRAAKRAGGMEKLEQQLDDVSKQMLAQGISITDFKPQGQPRAFEVGPGKVVEMVNGQQVERLRYTKWMVLVPTVTTFRAMLQSTPVEVVIIESTSFQVAISDKAALDWTFIDGSDLTVGDLRSIFGNLPLDLELPALEKKQVK
ncbi:MAG: hypothetical protein NWR03_00180 [Akkermansiaceae bacterium]|nr:hypothetical protein [Akkermansiaceae bacterium]MDP4896172.1 hypothetical protein [Akkermansiaceae bacterium]